MITVMAGIGLMVLGAFTLLGIWVLLKALTMDPNKPPF
jgi:hypothetical protein